MMHPDSLPLQSYGEIQDGFMSLHSQSGDSASCRFDPPWSEEPPKFQECPIVAPLLSLPEVMTVDDILEPSLPSVCSKQTDFQVRGSSDFWTYWSDSQHLSRMSIWFIIKQAATLSPSLREILRRACFMPETCIRTCAQLSLSARLVAGWIPTFKKEWLKFKANFTV